MLYRVLSSCSAIAPRFRPLSTRTDAPGANPDLRRPVVSKHPEMGSVELDRMFDPETMTLSSMRRSATATDALDRDPMRPLSITSRGEERMVCLSPLLWSVVRDVCLGRAIVFRVPIEAEHSKQVFARCEGTSEEAPGSLEWTVLVDDQPYHLHAWLTDSGEPSQGADMGQTIWRHHPRVASYVVSHWPHKGLLAPLCLS